MKGITKVFLIIRNKMKDKIHQKLKTDLMGNNLSEYGYPVFKIKCELIIYKEIIIYLIFEMVDRLLKSCRVYCVLNDITVKQFN